jgi:hypothetical protein
MAREWYESRCQEWTQAVIQQVEPAAICVFQDQVIDGPRPDRPYVTIALFSNVARVNASPEIKYTDTPVGAPSLRYENVLREHRTVTLAIMVYADNAMEIGRRFSFALWNDADLDLLLQGDADPDVNDGIVINGPIGETDAIENFEVTNNTTL